MNKTKLFLLWGTSFMIVVFAVGWSFLYQTQVEQKAIAQVQDWPQHSRIIQSENQAKALDISRKMIAQIYDYEPFAKGYVLGEQAPVVFKQEEISDISTPTVVRIFNQVNGTVTFPEFTVDFYNFQFVPTGTNYTENVEAGATGTGFFVSSNGHIMTNSHVVAEDIILEKFIGGALDYYGNVIRDQLLNLTDAEVAVIEQKLVERYGDDPVEAGLGLAFDILSGIEDYIYEKGVVNAEQTITVLDPGTTDIDIETRDDLVALANNSIPAKIIDINEDYKETYKDVALIQISHSATPFLSIDALGTPSAGQQIFIIGYPSSAELSESDLLSKTLTQGAISAVRKIEGINVYQTDAKIAQGSSGSPMINDKGQVIGIISFLNPELVGDGFGYAIPISYGQSQMTANGVNPTSNSYMSSFTQGLSFAQQSLCRKANEQFSLAQSLNTTFNNPSLQKYIDRCEDMIAAGTSKDGTWYQIMEKIKAVPIYAWAGLIALIGISIGAGFLFWRSKKVVVPSANSTLTSMSA